MKTDFSGIDFSNGSLKVSVENQTFQDVIEEVAGKTGIRIVISSPIDEAVTVSFDFLPLEKALRHLLSGKSHVFFYSSQAGNPAKLSQVLILPVSAGATGAVSGDMAGNNQARKLTAGKAPFPNRREMDAMLQDFSINDEDTRRQLYQAIEDLQKSNGFKDASQINKEISRQAQEAIKALKAMPNINITPNP